MTAELRAEIREALLKEDVLYRPERFDAAAPDWLETLVDENERLETALAKNVDRRTVISLALLHYAKEHDASLDEVPIGLLADAVIVALDDAVLAGEEPR